MTTTRWLGRAGAVSQLETITVSGTIAINDTFTVTINGKSLTFIATATTIANVTAGLVALLGATTAPTEFGTIAWADASPDITGTGIAGEPFTVTVSKSSAAGNISTATTTAASGPNHWDDAVNWSGGAVPVSSDDVHIDNSAVSVLYGLAQSAVTLDSFTIGASFTGYIGLPRTNASGYPEYRDHYLAISATSLKVGVGEGTKSGRIKINLGSNQSAVEVRSTGTSQEIGLPAVQLLGTHASNTLDVTRGSAGVAVSGGEVSTFASVLAAPAANVTLGAGCTLTTITTAGTLVTEASTTTVNVTNGNTILRGAAAFTTLIVTGGNCRYESSGTATAVTVGPGVIDASVDASPRTFTACTMKSGGTIIDPQRTVTYTGGITVDSNVDQIVAV